MTEKIDLTGRRFGRLTVIGKAEPRKSHRRWLCRCSCGQEKIVEESHLKSGHTKSCGCYRSERRQSVNMDLTGHRYGWLVVLGPAEGPEKKEGFWRCRCDCGNECICHKGNLRAGITKSCGCLQKEQRKKNMKKAIHFVDGTCVELIACRRTRSNNTSGHRGVYRRENGQWRAGIGFQGKRINLGTFANYEDAVNARLEAEKELYDTFLNEYKKG